MLLAYLIKTRTAKNRFKKLEETRTVIRTAKNRLKKLKLDIKVLFVKARFFIFAELTINTKHLVPYTKTQKDAPKAYRSKLYDIKLEFP